jgi:hypothetical protein
MDSIPLDDAPVADDARSRVLEDSVAYAAALGGVTRRILR